MARPEFPNPYIILPPGMISFIRGDQEYYDRNPEKAEREQAAQREYEEMEQEQLRQTERINDEYTNSRLCHK